MEEVKAALKRAEGVLVRRQSALRQPMRDSVPTRAHCGSPALYFGRARGFL